MREVVDRDRAADSLDPEREALRERPGVEAVRAVLGDLAQRRCEVRLLEDLAGLWEAAARTEDARALVIEAPSGRLSVNAVPWAHPHGVYPCAGDDRWKQRRLSFRCL